LLIARDFLSPVATKDVASTLRTPADLLDASLIHDERPDWLVDWLRSVGVLERT
jgi:LysR family glycine cleavage system transcriptional activator